MSGEVKPAAFDREIAFLTGLSARIGEAGVTLPKVEFHLGRTEVRFYVWGKDDWSLPDDQRAEKKRLWIEAEIAKVVDLFPGVEWEKNAPEGSYGESYYQLKAVWDDVTITVLTARADVCERVVVLEHDVTEEVPDPELVEKIPLVKVTQKKQVVEWQCNAAIAEKTAPLVGTKKAVSV